MRGRSIVSSILFQKVCEVVPENSGTKIQCLHIGKRGNAKQQLNVTGHHGKTAGFAGSIARDLLRDKVKVSQKSP